MFTVLATSPGSLCRASGRRQRIKPSPVRRIQYAIRTEQSEILGQIRWVVTLSDQWDAALSNIGKGDGGCRVEVVLVRELGGERLEVWIAEELAACGGGWGKVVMEVIE